jgi:aspartate/methionine/tyrosine aminotransferase
MQAIQLALQATTGAGDEIVYLSPAWPNFAAATGIAGATPVAVRLDHSDNGWSCDVDKVEAAITPRTKAIFVNSPSNPTGWTADRETLKAILDLARRHHLWIIADEIYALFFYGGRRAPSFMDIVDAEDRILFVNTFSKNWAMTGWRMGWIEAPPELGQTIENLLQYSTSGVATFLQRAGVAALERGESFVEHQIARARQGRDIVVKGLGATGKVRFAPASGAFYLFFAVEGKPDVRRLGLEIVDQANVGLAPGTAFGAGGEGFMRLCYLRSPEQLQVATQRLVDWLERI